MTADGPHAGDPLPKRRRRNTAGTPTPAGDVTFIRVPRPPDSAMNRDRPISDLIKAQLAHIHHAESARLPKEKRDGRRPEDIRTESEAASYIATVTSVLHPKGRKKPRRKPRS